MSCPEMNDCRELKRLPNPPEDIKITAAATLALLGDIGTIDVRNEKDPRMWKHFINNLTQTTGKGSIFSRMSAFDPKTVTPDQIQMAKRMVDGLSVEKICNVSMAASGLYKWVTQAIQTAEG